MYKGNSLSDIQKVNTYIIVKNVPRMEGDCYGWTIKECPKNVPRVRGDCYGWTIKECPKTVPRMSQDCPKTVPRLSQDCPKTVPRMERCPRSQQADAELEAACRIEASISDPKLDNYFSCLKD